MESRVGYATREEQLPKERTYQNPLEQQINHFDRNWKQEGLPYDWFNLDKVGFSMKGQMNLLSGLDYDSKTLWAYQTRRDILGFGLEYLREGTVFPFRYEFDNSGELVEPWYEKKMKDMVSPNERNGAVLASLTDMENYLRSEKEGAVAVMVSPSGWTGLRADNGESIVYQDTQVYFMRRHLDTVIGTTFRTDFNRAEGRELVKILTGVELPPDASVIDYVRTIALIPGSEHKEEQDMVFDLEKIRGGKNVYKDKTWGDMFEDLRVRDYLYQFDYITKRRIDEFESYVTSNDLSRFEIQKALAATILIISKDALFGERKTKTEQKFSENSFGRPYYEKSDYVPYGDVLDKVREIPGCAGGGSSAESLIDRLISPEPDKYGERSFDCPSCGKTNIRPKDELLKNCQHCGSNKVSC